MSYQATNGDSGGISKSVSGLGKGIGVIAAILGTPALFNATKAVLAAYLVKAWGMDIAAVLMWIMAVAEAYVIYAATALAFTALVISAMASYAARRFGG